MGYQAALNEDHTRVLCGWYALCENPAEWLSRGPVGDGEFDLLPICQRCAAKLEFPKDALQTYSITVEGDNVLITVEAA